MSAAAGWAHCVSVTGTIYFTVTSYVIKMSNNSVNHGLRIGLMAGLLCRAFLLSGHLMELIPYPYFSVSKGLD